MKYELPSAPLSIGGVIDSAIRLYRVSFRRCVIVALIYAAVVTVLSIPWGLAITQAAAQANMPGNSSPQQALGHYFSPGVIGGFAVMTLCSLVFTGALIKTQSASARGDESLSLGRAIAAGAQRLPGAVPASIISLLAIAVGFVLLIIPGFYLLCKLQLWMAAMFVDDASSLESLGTSWRLTRGRWWRAAAILTIALIMLYVFGIAFGLIAAIFAAMSHLSADGRMILNQAFTTTADVIVLPLFISIVLVMYHDFKLRNEGGDLPARVSSLSKA